MNLAKNCQILDSSRAQIKAFQPCFGGSPGKLGSVLKTRVIILHSWTLFSSSKAFKHNQFQHWKLTIFQLVSFEKCKQTDRGHPVMSHVFWGLWPLGDTWYNHLGQIARQFFSEESVRFRFWLLKMYLAWRRHDIKTCPNFTRVSDRLLFSNRQLERYTRALSVELALLSHSPVSLLLSSSSPPSSSPSSAASADAECSLP